jgi:hypothetical protein
VLNANPINDTRQPADQNYWIRTVPATGCSTFSSDHQPDNRTAILRYSSAAQADPTTTIANFPIACADEPYESLIPIVPWKIGQPVNEGDDSPSTQTNTLLTTKLEQSSTFQVGLSQVDPATHLFPGHGNFSRWEVTDTPLFLNLLNPVLLNPTQTTFSPDLDVINFSKTTVTKDSWIYLLITATGFPFESSPTKRFIPAAHPVSFAISKFIIPRKLIILIDSSARPRLCNPPAI